MNKVGVPMIPLCRAAMLSSRTRSAKLRSTSALRQAARVQTNGAGGCHQLLGVVTAVEPRTAVRAWAKIYPVLAANSEASAACLSNAWPDFGTCRKTKRSLPAYVWRTAFQDRKRLHTVGALVVAILDQGYGRIRRAINVVVFDNRG